ncbi:tetratricopeptide repeat protein, partial [Streptomyces sp. NPDC101116]
MSRLSREKKREQKQAAHAATPAAPIDVHVPGAGTDVGGGAGGVSDGASVGGVPVFAAPGEEIQRAVLNRLHHIALATGHPVLATIRDERIGYVVPLQVDPDGSSHFTSEPIATPPLRQQHPRDREAAS